MKKRKAYKPVCNAKRAELIKYVHEEGYTIKRASEITGVYYATAKVISKIYKRQGRVEKKSRRVR